MLVGAADIHADHVSTSGTSHKCLIYLVFCSAMNVES